MPLSEKHEQGAWAALQGQERFLSPQADALAGANAKEKVSARSVRNDGRVGPTIELRRLFDLRRSGGFGAGYQARERGGVLDRDIREDFAIERDAGGFQAVN